MKNIYYTSYFAFLSIILFTVAITLNLFQLTINFLSVSGILQPLTDIMPEKEIRILTFLGISFIIFLVLCGLKLITDLFWQFALLFFSKDREGIDLLASKKFSYVFILGGLLAVFLNSSLLYIAIVLLVTIIAFIILFFIKQSANFTVLGMIGFIVFQLAILSVIGSGVIYAYFTLFAEFITALPF
jgi:hypothetical protein